MSDKKYQKVKVVTFNTKNHMEKFLYDYTNSMKDDSQSFSGLMKHLLVAYLASTGNPPPGSLNLEYPGEKIAKKTAAVSKEETIVSKPKMGGGAFFYDDDED
jgi:hypothetical protein